MAGVKRIRSYDSRGRQEQALRNRALIVDVARRQFLEAGYAATTVASIASQATVSVETIYKSFGGKPGLVRAIVERGLAGQGAVPAEKRSDAMSSREPSGRQIVRGWVALVAEVAPLVAPLLSLLRTAAATDAELAAVLAAIDGARLERMRHNARKLARRGLLRPGVTMHEAADIMWTSTSSELYELLVVRRRWTMDRFCRFVATLLETVVA